MPHLSVTISSDGPIIDLLVGVGAGAAEAAGMDGEPIPAPVLARALVDTGASHSLVDASIIVPLRLSVLDFQAVNSATSGSKPRSLPVYDVSIALPTRPRHVVRRSIPVPAVEFSKEHGFTMLLGRDVLRDCVLEMNGPENRLTLTF